MKKVMLLCALLITMAASTVSAGSVTTISNQEVLQQIQNKQAPLILDVRTDGEYSSGHIPGALHIPHTELPGRLSELSAYKNKSIYLYCHSGYRVGISADILEKAGFTSLHHIAGDMQVWKAAGLPIEK